MKYFYKIIRWSAWFLVFITIAVFISGFTPAKSFLFPEFLRFEYSEHLEFAIFGFLPLFYIHSLGGIFILMARHQWLSKKGLKIMAGAAWTVLNAFFVYAYFVQIPFPPVNQNNLPGANQLQNVATSAPIILTAAQVATHNKSADCWMIISGNVYNLTGYASYHPGRASDILNYCGQDGTNAYATKNRGTPHSGYADNLLVNYYLGKVGETITPAETGQNQPPNQNQNLPQKGSGRDFEDE
jgi:cytochrome b involved in lipid metabolism